MLPSNYMVWNGCSIQKIRMQRTVMGVIMNKYHVLYLTRHIYMDHNSGDRNSGSTKIWGFFSEIPKFRTPN